MLALHLLLLPRNALTITLHLSLTRQVSCTDNRAITMYLLYTAIFTSFHFTGSSRRGGDKCSGQTACSDTNAAHFKMQNNDTLTTRSNGPF